MRKTILVAGGAGFIGSHLCTYLLEQKYFVVCVDNISTGNNANISKLVSLENFQFIQTDISKRETKEALIDRSFDEIYHLASPASVSYVVKNPVEAAVVNSIGTLHLLELARQNKAKILFTSSSECYGDPKVHPQKETYWGNVNPVGIRSGYDEGKRFGEALCMAFKRQLNVDVKIVRIFNTYGQNSRIDDSRVIPTFVTQAILNKSLTVHGDGTQTRSFCYVSDMVEGLVKMMEADITGPVNLGNPNEYKIINLAKKIIEMTSSSSKISFVQRPQDDPEIRRPDITLAKEKLNWTPHITLEQGLIDTISYFNKILQR